MTPKAVVLVGGLIMMAYGMSSQTIFFNFALTLFGASFSIIS